MLQRLRAWLYADELDHLRCPQCFNYVPIGTAGCPRCGRAVPPIFDVPERPRATPLTHKQRAWLRRGSLLLALGPLALFLVIGLVLGLGSQSWEASAAFGLAGVGFMAMTAPDCLRQWLDAKGAALVQPAYLLDLVSLKSPSDSRVPNYYAHFAQLGRFAVTREEFERLFVGGRYQLTYSPRSRKLWAFRAV
jgi:hypothetical protein